MLIRHFRARDHLASLEAVVQRSSFYLSSVVAMELRAGCKTKSELRTLSQFQRPFEQGGRLVTPNHEIFCQAGAVLAELGSAFGFEVEKRRRMANDVLIGLCAVSIGAALITLNRADFVPIAQCIPLIWYGSAEEFVACSAG